MMPCQAKRRGRGGGEGRARSPNTECLAFSIFDSNQDGYVTKEEFLRSTSKLTEKQVEYSHKHH
jgi:Ca2+-binding EF-hand superfamily protein